MTERFQNNDNNTDNQNTLNIPVQPKRPNYRQPQQKNPNTRRPIRPLNQQQNNNYNRNHKIICISSKIDVPLQHF